MWIIIVGLVSALFLSVADHTPQNVNEWDYTSKVKQKDAKVKYEKKLMPESGYMTVQEYEIKSMSKDKSQGDGNFIPKVEDSKMKYVPQPHYKLVRYNNPPGSQELKIDRKAHFDRQEVMRGIIASDATFMAIPVVSYYARTHSTECDVYILPLREGMPDVEKVIKANIAAKEITPILSTERSPLEYGTFRTITPVDFSTDMNYLLAKEKTGSAEDGMWQTELLVYDFTKKEARKLTEVREAIRYYWRTTKDLDLREVRWDIYPLGFDFNNPDRIIVAAYAYTGVPTRTLGTWSVDCRGEQVRMESLTGENVTVSSTGLKIIEDGVIDPESVIAETKLAEAYEKKEKKEAKKAEREKKKQLKKEYKEEVKEIKATYKKAKKEDNSDFSRKEKVYKHMPFVKTKGGRVTGTDSLTDD